MRSGPNPAYLGFAGETDIASASTCDIGAAPTDKVRVTGTTTITSFGTVPNVLRFVRFGGALTLTHNATSLILPGGANIAAASGDIAVAASDTSGNWRLLTYLRIAGRPLNSGVTDGLTAGFSASSYAAGTKSSGTFTPDPASGNFQHATNGGAHTLAPPSATCSIVLEYLNNGSAGAVTTSGFTKVTGDSFTTTNGYKFACFITRTNSYSHLHVQGLQ